MDFPNEVCLLFCFEWLFATVPKTRNNMLHLSRSLLLRTPKAVPVIGRLRNISINYFTNYKRMRNFALAVLGVDFPKAFDTIDRYGFKNSSQNVSPNYCMERKQFVVIDNKFSDFEILVSDVK